MTYITLQPRDNGISGVYRCGARARPIVVQLAWYEPLHSYLRAPVHPVRYWVQCREPSKSDYMMLLRRNLGPPKRSTKYYCFLAGTTCRMTTRAAVDLRLDSTQSCETIFPARPARFLIDLSTYRSPHPAIHPP